MHFQYNGFLYGILILSIVEAKRVNIYYYYHYLLLLMLLLYIIYGILTKWKKLGSIIIIRHLICYIIEF